MSATDANSVIYVTDIAKEIKTKVDSELFLFSWKKYYQAITCFSNLIQ